MKFEGVLTRDGKFWVVEIPGLDLMTQGRSKTEALRMAKSVVEDIVGKPKFKVQVESVLENKFLIGSDDTTELVALMLQRQRAKQGLTLIEVADRLGSKSPNALGAYEQGKREPSIGQLENFLRQLIQKEHSQFVSPNYHGSWQQSVSLSNDSALRLISFPKTSDASFGLIIL